MRFRSLKSKLLLAVSALVIGSGLLISLVVTQRYSRSLLEAVTAQAENLAHATALEATDKVLINDLVALQKMLDHQLRSNPSIAYLFILRDDLILAHTFTKGVPVDLISANEFVPGKNSHFRKITSTTGEHYLDIAWPIFGGKAGFLRLGLSEKPYRQQMAKLWLQMSALTLGILLFALTVTLVLVRRVTRPLGALAEATRKIDKGELDVRVQVQGEDEVATLADSFNHMIERIEDYTQRLEEQTLDLERAHHQTRTVCGIVQEIGALRSLHEIGSTLIQTFQNILKCGHMVLLILNGNREFLFALSAREVKTLRESQHIKTATAALEGLTNITFTKKKGLSPPLVPDDFQEAVRQAIIPLHHEKQLLGALVIGCPGGCSCSVEEIDVVGLMLGQAAGAIKRAVLQEEEINDLQRRLESSAEFSGIIGKDPKMQLIYKLIEDIAPTDATVLIQGESGTGKELVARAIHRRSPRKNKPFVVINCSAYPATLLESELFGHEKGAFTGAIRQKSGRFEQAHGGTVLLDEIAEISPSAQIKLLRVLQTQKFERIGGEKTLNVNVRIIAATNKELLQQVKQGTFREDLYYRLNVIPINLPPLGERRNDIPLLARHFLRRFAAEQSKKIDDFSPESLRLLLDYPWPGNVRELENSVEHATVLAKGSHIEASDLPTVLHTAAKTAQRSTPPTLVEHESKLLVEVLEDCGWNKKQAAKRLGISRSTLYEKLKKYQIT
ncbi:MAG: HAMP domain-containing protein, partial [Dehalococcoidia bacterium]|nr:HAMP domain-containing protein [Dehalococcoidia bacterium]